MVDGIKNGAAPKAVTTYMEEPARRAFEAGPRDVPAQLAVRLRAPPSEATATKGKFKVAPFPEFEGGGKAGILGGANLVDLDVHEEPGRGAEVHRLHDARASARTRTS